MSPTIAISWAIPLPEPDLSSRGACLWSGQDIERLPHCNSSGCGAAGVNLIKVIPSGTGSKQTVWFDVSQHFLSSGQSISNVHGTWFNDSTSVAGHIPGLEANSLDLFRAAGQNI